MAANPVALKTDLGKLTLKSPVIMASGTFGFGYEMREFIDYRWLGAFVTKTLTLGPKPGNTPPRLRETAAGMINCIGLQNPGIETFIREILPRLRNLGPKLIVSIGGTSLKEFCYLAELLREKEVEALELNISCPNIEGGRLIATSPRLTFQLVNSVRRICPGMCISVKLSPVVTDISPVAIAAAEAGADVLTLINTVSALAVDIPRQRVITGGLSGPAIKPIGLKAVYEVYRKVDIPLIGLGGILTGTDALEYIMVGASAVGVGSGFFANPLLPVEIVNTLLASLKKFRVTSLKQLVGRLNEKKKRRTDKQSD